MVGSRAAPYLSIENLQCHEGRIGSEAIGPLCRNAVLLRAVGGSPRLFDTGRVENKMGGFDRITFDPAILGGRACIRGMRIPVSVIVKQIAHGAAREEVLADYPDLESEDVQQALEYAAWLSQEEVRSA